MRWLSLCLAAACAASLVGCSKEGPYRKPTRAVRGKVLVDGAAPPAEEPVQIECFSLNGLDQQHPTFSRCDSGPDGAFEIATYEKGDGVPAGSYALTFAWQKFDLLSRQYSGPDKLKGKYRKAEASTVRFEIKESEIDEDDLDLGTIELQTK